MLTTSAEPGSRGAGAADEQQAVVVDLERRVVDAVVVVLGPSNTIARPAKTLGCSGSDR
jgi:hypothetical protein